MSQLTRDPSPAADPRADWVTTRRRPRKPGPYRKFVVTIRDNEVADVEGYGATVDDVVAYLEETHQEVVDREAGPGRQSLGELARDLDDRAAWEGYRLVAIHRPMPDGSGQVTRFD